MTTIIGHDNQKSFLERFVVGSLRHHAFILSGPEHVGKRQIAMAFARMLADATPRAWTLTRGAHADCIVLAPPVEEKKGMRVVRDIGVEMVCDARRLFALAADGAAKVLIVDDAHRMTIAAQNALLKTLEEPSHSGVVVLVTHQPGLLLDTIVSRCVRVRFATVSDADFVAAGVDAQTARDAQGRPGFVHRLRTDADFAACVADARTMLQQLAKTPTYALVDAAARLAKEDDAYVTAFFTVWVHRIRAAAYATGNAVLLLMAHRVDAFLRSFHTINVNRQLAIEDVLLRINRFS